MKNIYPMGWWDFNINCFFWLYYMFIWYLRKYHSVSLLHQRFFIPVSISAVTVEECHILSAFFRSILQKYCLYLMKKSLHSLLCPNLFLFVLNVMLIKKQIIYLPCPPSHHTIHAITNFKQSQHLKFGSWIQKN